MSAVNIYLKLTREFNEGRLRAVICSGQAVVLHRLAVMSKDGDWVLREDEETLAHVLGVLGEYGATYRYGAPLDLRWLKGGWSSHFEFRREGLRVRVDFFTRPPRIDAAQLDRLWRECSQDEVPFVDLKFLADMKKTNRERDYAVIGELARMMQAPADQLLYSRSARDLMALADRHPRLVAELSEQRPVLQTIGNGREELEAALDAERRNLIRDNEKRLEQFALAAEAWYGTWPSLEKDVTDRPLAEAHQAVVQHAERVLPFEAAGAGDHA